MHRITVVLLAMIAGLIVACGSGDAASAPGRQLPPTNGEYERVLELPRGNVATPDFTLRTSDEEVVRLSDYRGSQPLAVIFYRGFF